MLIWQIRGQKVPRPKRSSPKKPDFPSCSQGLRGGGSKGEENKQKTCTQTTKKPGKEWWKAYRWIEDYDIVHLMQKWSPKHPIPIIKAQDIMEEMETIQDNIKNKKSITATTLIINTGQHWVLGRYIYKEKRMRIYEPFSSTHKLESTRKLQENLKLRAWTARITYTNKQHEDDSNTCGYHVLKWAQDIVNSTQPEMDWKPPTYSQLEAEQWCDSISQALRLKQI